jgi:hypothetical protein
LRHRTLQRECRKCIENHVRTYKKSWTKIKQRQAGHDQTRTPAVDAATPPMEETMSSLWHLSA